MSAPAQSLLRLHISPTADWKLRSGHPWLYSDSILEQSRAGELGDLAAVYDRHNNFLAIGLFDPDSPLRVRVLHRGKPRTIDAAWWTSRFQEARARRQGLFDDQTTGYRLIHGENDGWPGLVLDCYEETLVLKVYTAAWLPRLEQIIAIIKAGSPQERLILRLSRNSQEVAKRRFNREDGQIVFGPPLAGPVIFRESGLRFEADVVRGQKTGFFLDQRENRKFVETLSSGREVLNAFSFSGGFSLYAARGGARSVTDLDISGHALESATRNFALNKNDLSVARCRHETVQADAFKWLEQNTSRLFDLAVLDPPSLARREAERAGAIQAYGKLAWKGISRLRRGGILASASCSAHVSEYEFFGAVRDAARQSGRTFQEMRATGHPPDHLAKFAEAHYLKCLFLQF